MGRLRKAAAAVMIVASVCAVLIPQASSFAVTAEAPAPRLLGASPAGGGTLGRDTVMALSFDRPMDLYSLGEAASFDPPVAFEVSGEAEILITPLNLLEGGREYGFSLRPGIAHDLEGSPCDDGMEIDFSTRDDAIVITIPAMSYSGAIVEGGDATAVVNMIGLGAGHYPGAGRPGHGNFVLMAHASGRIDFPFNHLFDLKAGDNIDVTCGGRTYRYIWAEGRVVADTEVWILDASGFPVLTIFVCCAADGRPSPTFHPPFRYVVRAVPAVSKLGSDPDFRGLTPIFGV